jgi:hypothetical protein
VCGDHKIGKLKKERMSREGLRKTHKCFEEEVFMTHKGEA